ncbi:unnamed protein product [Arabidopsis arenosa]|uniref:KIB1-4 beta-propeller domain-containing protein n=1 Tax=Arabidopsis arenosa TaxID=38785 RepID=A0A8S2A972_ARAAE|nr:unnamed protein product [Arabidopsis arenosa]
MERSTLKRQLSSPDLEPAKALRSTLIPQPKAGSPLLILSTEKDGYRLCNPADERVVYETKSDLSGEERIDLPPLESLKGSLYKIERVGENKVRNILYSDLSRGDPHTAEDLRGRLWVGDNKEDYVVVWHFEMNDFLGFCKKGDDHYREILTRTGVRRELRGVKDMVLKGYSLYVLAIRDFIRHLDLSGHGEDGIKDVSENHKLPMWMPSLSVDEQVRVDIDKISSSSESIAVTRSGQVLVVCSYELGNSEVHRMFHVYKRDPKDLDPKTYLTQLLEVHSLGDEALFLDLGTTGPADHTRGIEPNSIYFTHGDRIRHRNPSRPDICVFNLTTKTIKRFLTLSNLNVKDAQWFLPLDSCLPHGFSLGLALFTVIL